MTAASGPQDWPPAPPGGYRYYDGPSSLSLAGRLLVVLCVFLSLLAVFVLTIATHGFRLLGMAFPEPAEFPVYVVSVLSLGLLMLVVHELLHVLTAKLLGYEVDVDFGFETVLDWTFTVIPHGEFQSRTDTAVIALAPLLAFTPVGIAVLVFGGKAVAAAAAFLLTLNAVGAFLDIRTAVLMLSLPRGTLVRHDREGREQSYAPEKSG